MKPYLRPKQLRGLGRTVAVTLSLILCLAALPAVAQVNVLTQHNDNFRTGLNPNETILTPSNVNAANFGIIATRPVDGLIAAEPLYVSNVNIPGQGVHNVVYVVTLHDSVYAFDADNARGTNANPLWQVNFLNVAAGVTTEPAIDLGCTSTTGFSEMGILGTPVIDPSSQTMYVVAKTKENGTYHFRLHALDITSGMEKFGGPLNIDATVTGKLGSLMLSASAKNMLARPGMLLSQGVVYVSFGSNGCDGKDTRGWVVAYGATSLLQMGVLNDTLDTNAARGNIWMSGSGIASDDNGNLFFSTANGGFDANTGGNDYGSSIVRVGWNDQGQMATKDYFTPYNVTYLNSTDLDIGSAGVLMLPDQPGPHTHLVVGSGKEGSVYLLDRDNMGHFNPTDNSQIVQFIAYNGTTVPPQSHTPPGSQVGRMFSTPAYWNGYVYVTGQNQGLTQFSMQNGQMILLNRNATTMCCAHTPSISSNGATNGIVWIPNGNGFMAYDASDATLPVLYNNNKMGTLAHFNTPMVANGRVFVGANLNLQMLGLLGNVTAVAGDNQTVPPVTALPQPLQVSANDPYSGVAIAGVTVTFSDGNKGGTFNPATAITDSAGKASTTYTSPKVAGTYTLTATYPSSKVGTMTVNVTSGPATHVTVVSGSKQTEPLLTAFPLPLVVQLADAYNNGVVGGIVNFSVPANSGTFSVNGVTTDSKGRAQTFYTSGTKSGPISVTATSGAFHQSLPETVQSGPATGISLSGGNFQKGPISTTLPAQMVVKVVDQYGNGVTGAQVSFSDGGVGGSVSASPVTTNSVGQAGVLYTLPPTPQTVHVIATATGVTPTVSFTATAQ